MTLDSLSRAIPPGDRILLDSTTLIAYLNGGEAVSPIAAHTIDVFVHAGRNQAVISMISAMEVLVRPLRVGPPAAYRHVHDFLTRYPHCSTAEIDLAVAQEAAALRATYALKPPDALIVATGLVHQVGHLVTNDSAWIAKLAPLARRLRVCSLATHLPFP